MCTKRVCSLVGKYEKFEIVFSFNVKDNNIVLCLHNIRLSYNIILHASVLCQSECACLHKTVNMVVSLFKVIKIPTQKGEHCHANVQSCPYTKRGNCVSHSVMV